MQQPVQAFHGMVSRSPAMAELFTLIGRAARSDASVLVRGETGSGKELVARALHALSPRAGKPFLAVNCATLQGELLASELFGHVRGAYTGAIQNRKGLFERANGGTVFLDEIGELPLELQPRLLRVLQESRFTPVGGSDPVDVDVRVISATHRALRREVDEHRFRADLMFRVRVARLILPPLRDRPEDIETLLSHFIATLRSPVRTLHGVDPTVLPTLRAYDWPGNVRELRNVVESALAMGEGPLLNERDLAPEIRGEAPPDSGPGHDGPRQERERLLTALAEARGNRQRAADALGISRTTLWRRMRELLPKGL